MSAVTNVQQIGPQPTHMDDRLNLNDVRSTHLIKRRLLCQERTGLSIK